MNGELVVSTQRGTNIYHKKRKASDVVGKGKFLNHPKKYPSDRGLKIKQSMIRASLEARYARVETRYQKCLEDLLKYEEIIRSVIDILIDNVRFTKTDAQIIKSQKLKLVC